MRIDEIQNGTSVYLPQALENKVIKFNVEDFRKDTDNEELFTCRLQADGISERLFAEQWEPVEDRRKSPDHINLFVPYTSSLKYGGMLTFYFTESGALTELRNINRK